MDRLKLQTLELRNRIAPVLDDAVPRWGRGALTRSTRTSRFSSTGVSSDLPPSELIGASDFPSLWNQAPREGLQLHWDGDNDSVDERNLSAGLGAGITPVTVDHAGLQRVRDWIWTLPPPPYPYEVNAVLAARGATVYQQECLACHGDHRFKDGIKSGDRLGRVVDVAEVGTDRYRLDSYTPMFAANQYSLFPDSPYRFKRFRKTNGYANHPLDGIWARAPYLHNGSIPTLRDLLEVAREAAGLILPRLRPVRPGPRRICLGRTRSQRPAVLPLRHVGARQQQQRSPVRHVAPRRRQAARSSST